MGKKKKNLTEILRIPVEYPLGKLRAAKLMYKYDPQSNITTELTLPLQSNFNFFMGKLPYFYSILYFSSIIMKIIKKSMFNSIFKLKQKKLNLSLYTIQLK